MMLFGRKKAYKKGRQRLEHVPGQKVISYYTASRRQLDDFERDTARNGGLNNKYLHSFKQSWFVFLCFGVLIIAVSYLCLLGSDPHLIVSGPSYRPTSYYQKVSKEALKGDFRNRFKFSLMSEKIEASLRGSLPELESVEVKSSFLGHRPEIKIYTSSYLANFSQNSGDNYVLSVRGRLLLPVSESTFDLKEIPVIQNKTGVNGKEGEQFISPDEAKDLLDLVNQYKADSSLPALTLTVVPHELLAQEPGRAYYARFQLDGDIIAQYGSLRATEKRLQEIGQSPAQYVDVRLKSKVYFK